MGLIFYSHKYIKLKYHAFLDWQKIIYNTDWSTSKEIRAYTDSLKLQNRFNSLLLDHPVEK